MVVGEIQKIHCTFHHEDYQATLSRLHTVPLGLILISQAHDGLNRLQFPRLAFSKEPLLLSLLLFLPCRKEKWLAAFLCAMHQT